MSTLLVYMLLIATPLCRLYILAAPTDPSSRYGNSHKQYPGWSTSQNEVQNSVPTVQPRPGWSQPTRDIYSCNAPIQNVPGTFSASNGLETGGHMPGWSGQDFEWFSQPVGTQPLASYRKFKRLLDQTDQDIPSSALQDISSARNIKGKVEDAAILSENEHPSSENGLNFDDGPLNELSAQGWNMNTDGPPLLKEEMDLGEMRGVEFVGPLERGSGKLYIDTRTSTDTQAQINKHVFHGKLQWLDLDEWPGERAKLWRKTPFKKKEESPDFSGHGCLGATVYDKLELQTSQGWNPYSSLCILGSSGPKTWGFPSIKFYGFGHFEGNPTGHDLLQQMQEVAKSLPK
ncbi:uncharacterized protein UTRI_10540 [Ustilago trichophora]|uniref:Effector family protein Eff1 n=1 Tax=Ustilago trichophora TaxID=86804 RepID=A0A5C3E9S2_9BASI|nr:uncharacterized protein UTRI_10540 [Ustilago trichophora]